MNAPFTRRASLLDSFSNLIAGLGVWGRDKVLAQRPVLHMLEAEQLTNLYRGDWLARKIVDIPAFDATRAWRTWQADKSDVSKIEEMERSFGLQKKCMEAFVKARLFGGAAMVLGVKGAGDWNEELDIKKVEKGSLKFIHVVTGGRLPMVAAGPRVRDITSPWFGEPSYYQRSNQPPIPGPGDIEPPKSIQIGKRQADPMLMIHPSRVVRITGLDYPDMETAQDAWGDSALQPVWDAIRDAGLVGQSIANLTARANVNVFKVPGLTQKLSSDAGTKEVTARFANANIAQSVINAILLDATEEWVQLSVNFSQLPQIVQMYLLIAAAAADIPATRLLAREPSGQNATGDSDTRNYYDRLSSDQKVRVTPLLSRLDEVLKANTFGTVPKDMHYDWNPLWQMDDEQASQVILRKAQAFAIDVNSGLLDPLALKTGRENQLVADDVYPGLQGAIEEAEEKRDAEGENLHEDNILHPEESPEAKAALAMQQAKPAPGGAAGNGQAKPGEPGPKKPNGNGGANGAAARETSDAAVTRMPKRGRRPTPDDDDPTDLQLSDEAIAGVRDDLARIQAVLDDLAGGAAGQPGGQSALSFSLPLGGGRPQKPFRKQRVKAKVIPLRRA